MNLSLKMKILESNKSQIAIARELEVPEQFLSKIVRGWIDPKPELKEKIASALNAQVADLFPGDEVA
jgi:DNA-binding XRE family transcriptional regulator